MRGQAPLPLEVQEAVIRACGQALHYHDDLRKVLRRAGVSESGIDRYSHQPKYVLTRNVLAELDRAGAPGWRVQQRLVEELAALEGPHRHAPDQRAGREALSRLREMAIAGRILVNPEEAARQQARAAAAAAAEARSAREARLADLNREFAALHAMTDRQGRGYAFEKLLHRLFALHELEYSCSYRTATDQIDGSVVLDSFTYLLEARWRQEVAVAGDLRDFSATAEQRLHATRGLFVSMAGFRAEAVDLFRGRNNRLILVDGQDVAMALENRPSFIDMLREKVRMATLRGEPYYRASQML